MTTIQLPHTRWVPRELVALACTVCVLLLSAAAARAGTPLVASLASDHSPASQSTHTPAAHALAAQTRALRTCLRTHPQHCAAAKRAFERAGRLAATQARSARRSTHRSARSHSTGTPAPTPSTAPPSSSTGVAGSIGGSESNGAGSSGGLGSSGSGSGTTPSQSAPLESLESASPNFQPGLNSGSNTTYDIPGAVQLGAKLVRLDMNIEQTPQELESIVAAYAAKGIRVMPLADFNGTLPTPAEAQNLATWARVFGPGGTFWAGRSDGQLAIQSIEFGNETSYSYQYSNDTPTGYAARAQTYALRFAEAATAIRAVNPGVGLLAQGDAGNAGPLWVENMFKAVPNLGQLVAGWTIHPYGPGWRGRLEALIGETAAQGAPSTIPIDITEWGLATDNGHCLTENYGWPTCMTYDEAGAVLTRTVREMHEVLGDRFGMFLLYQVRDQQATSATDEREAYFGALQHELQPKGAYTTAVQEVLAS